MPLFAIPLSAAVRRSNISRKYSSDGSSRKRKRKQASSDESSSSDGSDDDDLVAQSTNPLSLTPDEIVQYRLAGLSLNKRLPQEKGYIEFPHRRLPADAKAYKQCKHGKFGGKERRSVTTESGVDSFHSEKDDHEGQDEEATRRFPARGHRLRLQHLSVLTAVVHKCLLEGDIKRATRAFSLLIRTETMGKALDITSTGYWGIGAELLIRSQQQGKSNKFHRVSDSESESDSGSEDLGREEPNENRDNHDLKSKTWGSKQGFELAKSYYETLILQYPYKKQFHNYVSSLDFWPAMAACEIYGIQSERENSLRNHSHRYKHDSSFSSDDDSDPEDHFEDAQENFEDTVSGSPTPSDIRRRARKDNRVNQIWKEKDNIRTTALAASESLAERMDSTMSYPPFDNDLSMLRLRGMLGFYIGDLHAPQRPDELQGDEDDRDHRFVFIQRKADYERGLARRKGIWEDAKKFFEKCMLQGGPDSGTNFDLWLQLTGREESMERVDERLHTDSSLESDDGRSQRDSTIGFDG
jgi:hypothetical protein